MIKCILIEDEKSMLDIIKQELTFYNDIVILGTASSINEANVLIDSTKPDLCIADIQLSDGIVFESFSKLTEIFFDIIFITAHEEYALKAIKFSALDYILKPLDFKEFHESMNRFIKNFNAKQTDNLRLKNLLQSFKNNVELKRIIIPVKEEYEIFNVDDIEYCESDGCYTIFHFFNSTKILSSKPVGFYEDLLIEHNFCRIHQQYLVNVGHVKSLLKGNPLTIKLKSGNVLPVSRLKKSDFLKLFLH